MPAPQPTPPPWLELGLPVPLPLVEKALKELWDNDHASTKATLINLILLSSKPGSLRENNALVAALTHDHACRVLLVEATAGTAHDNPGLASAIEATNQASFGRSGHAGGNKSSTGKAGSQAWISAHCHLSNGQKSVCSEQIAFRLDRACPGLIRNTVLAHLLGDLPVALWWQGGLDEVFEPGLFRHIDRLIIDSAAWPAGERSGQIQLLQAARDTLARPFSLHDIAWTRTYQFRIALAAMFDHPHAVQAIPGICSGAVLVGPGQSATGQLLVAWIAHTLGWQVRSKGAETWEFIGVAGKVIPFAIVEHRDAAPLAMVRLDHPSGSVRVSREAGSRHIAACIGDGSGLPPVILPADADSAGELVASLLSRGGKTSLHRAVLPVFLAMARLDAAEEG